MEIIKHYFTIAKQTAGHAEGWGQEEATMTNHIEIQRSNVTVAEFLNYIKWACAKKGMSFEMSREDFEKPDRETNSRYYIKDGIKYATCDGYRNEWPADDTFCQSEIFRVLPYNHQTYFLNFDGCCYNEIIEFTFDDDKRGNGYYYQANKDADTVETPA